MATAVTLFVASIALAFGAGVAVGIWYSRDAIRFVLEDLKLAKQQHEHMATSLQLRATQLARKEDELETVEAQLLEAKAEIVMLTGGGPTEAA